MALLTRKCGYFSTQTGRRGWERLRNPNLRLYSTARGYCMTPRHCTFWHTNLQVLRRMQVLWVLEVLWS